MGIKQEYHVLMFKDIRVSAPCESSVDFFLRHVHLTARVSHLKHLHSSLVDFSLILTENRTGPYGI